MKEYKGAFQGVDVARDGKSMRLRFATVDGEIGVCVAPKNLSGMIPVLTRAEAQGYKNAGIPDAAQTFDTSDARVSVCPDGKHLAITMILPGDQGRFGFQLDPHLAGGYCGYSQRLWGRLSVHGPRLTRHRPVRALPIAFKQFFPSISGHPVVICDRCGRTCPGWGQSMPTIICGFFAAALLWGCAASANTQWAKDGVPGLSGDLEIDTFICERWSPAGGGRINPETFRTCMIARGWEPVDGASASRGLAQQ